MYLDVLNITSLLGSFYSVKYWLRFSKSNHNYEVILYILHARAVNLL